MSCDSVSALTESQGITNGLPMATATKAKVTNPDPVAPIVVSCPATQAGGRCPAKSH